jgi:hypothetical protein
MVRFVIFRLLLIAGINCSICAFLVNQQHAHRKPFGIYPIKSQQLQRGERWHGSRLSQLSDSTNERGKDIADSQFIVDATTIGRTVPKITEELDRQNQGRIYKAYQDLISYIMRTPLWRDYSLSLTMKPIVTKSFSSMIGFFVGDILAQIIFRRVSELFLEHCQSLISLKTSSFLISMYSLSCVLREDLISPDF